MANEYKILDRSVLSVNEGTIKQAVAKLTDASKESQALTEKQKWEIYQGLDKQAKAALRIFAVDNKVRTKYIGAEFYETIDLLPDEAPVYQLDDPRPNIPVRVVSQLGGSAQVIASTNSSYTPFPLLLHESAIVKTQRFDIYQGFNKNNDKINRDLADSVATYLDDMAWVANNAAIGAFTNLVFRSEN